MPYEINKSDDISSSITVADGTFNASALSIILIGRGFDGNPGGSGYGEIQQENIVHILENFCNVTPPANPTYGQLWFNPADDSVNVYETSDTWRDLNEFYAGSIYDAAIAANAQIQLSKLEDGLPGQIIVVDNVGVPTYKTMSGDATIDHFGTVSLQNNTVNTAELVSGIYVNASQIDASALNASIANVIDLSVINTIEMSASALMVVHDTLNISSITSNLQLGSSNSLYSYYTTSTSGHKFNADILTDNKVRIGSTTPNDTWGTGYSILELGSTATFYGATGTEAAIAFNGYRDNIGWKYQNTAVAGLYQNAIGNHYWYVAPSGTADTAIPFELALKIENSGIVKGLGGNWLISPGGTDFTPNANLVIYTADSAGAYTQYANVTTGATGADGFFVGIDVNENALLHNTENTDMFFYTSNAFRGKIDSGGNWLISPQSIDVATPARNLVVHGGSATSVIQLVTTNSGVTSGDGFQIQLQTDGPVNLNNKEGYIHLYATDAYAGMITSGQWMISPAAKIINNELVVFANDLTGSSYAQFVNNTADASLTIGVNSGFKVGIDASANAELYNGEATAMKMYTAGALRGGITSAGKWIISSGGAFGTPAYDLLIHGMAGQAFMQFVNTASSDGSLDGLQIGLNADLSASIIQRENAALNFYTANTVRGYIQANGLLNWNHPVVGGEYLQATGGNAGALDTRLYLTSSGNGNPGRGVRIEVTIPGNDSTEEGATLDFYTTNGTTTSQSCDMAIRLASGGAMYERARLYSNGTLLIGNNDSTTATSITPSSIVIHNTGSPNIELRSSNGGTPFIDFSNDSVIDYDGRIVLSADGGLSILGTGLVVGGPTGGNKGVGTVNATILYVNNNAVWHAGNDGTGSGLDADLLDGRNMAESSIVSTIVSRDSSGDISTRLFRSEYDTTNPTINYVMTQIDTTTNNYIRPSTIAQLKTTLQSMTKPSAFYNYLFLSPAISTVTQTVLYNSAAVPVLTGDMVYISTAVSLTASGNSLVNLFWTRNAGVTLQGDLNNRIQGGGVILGDPTYGSYISFSGWFRVTSDGNLNIDLIGIAKNNVPAGYTNSSIQIAVFS